MALATGTAYIDPNKIIGSQKQVNDSMAAQVAALSSKDSELNRMAATEGLKAANRRGLLNSSMAVGASHDAVLKNVMPIASQDAQTAANKNAAARAFEYGMVAQEDTQKFQTGERLGAEKFQGTQAGLDRALQQALQTQQITSNEKMQLKQIQSTEGIEAANRALEDMLQKRQQTWQTGERIGTQTYQAGEAAKERTFQTGERVATQAWQKAENIAQRAFVGTQADLDRDLQESLQDAQIDATEANLIRTIAAEKGIADANRAMQKLLAEKDIAFRMSEGKLDRASAEKMQAQDIAFQKAEGKLTRELQSTIAGWNLKASDREGASKAVANTESMYQTQYQTIMNNTKMDAKARTKALTAAKDLRDKGLKMVEQLYKIDLKW